MKPFTNQAYKVISESPGRLIMDLAVFWFSVNLFKVMFVGFYFIYLIADKLDLKMSYFGSDAKFSNIGTQPP